MTFAFASIALFLSPAITRADALKYEVDPSFFYPAYPAKGADGVTPVVAFDALHNAPLPAADGASPTRIDLGSVVITPPSPGQSVDFQDAKFHLEVRVPGLDTVVNPTPDDFWWHAERNVIMLDGRLNGHVIGGGTSSLTMSVDSIKLGSYGPFIPEETRNYHFPIALDRLGFDAQTITLAPGATSGRFSVALNVAPVPEPATWMLFALAGLGIRRGLKRTAL